MKPEYVYDTNGKRVKLKIKLQLFTKITKSNFS